MTCFYHVTEYILLAHHNIDDNGNSHHGNLIPDFIGKAFVAIMMMGMMVTAAGAIIHIIVAASVPSLAEADLLTSERWFLFAEGARRLGVAMYLVGITLGLTTIVKVIRFQANRVRELV